jgi:hypothetical protein
MLVDRAPLSDDEEGGLQSAIRGERSEQSDSGSRAAALS